MSQKGTHEHRIGRRHNSFRAIRGRYNLVMVAEDAERSSAYRVQREKIKELLQPRASLLRNQKGAVIPLDIFLRGLKRSSIWAVIESEDGNCSVVKINLTQDVSQLNNASSIFIKTSGAIEFAKRLIVSRSGMIPPFEEEGIEVIIQE